MAEEISSLKRLEIRRYLREIEEHSEALNWASYSLCRHIGGLLHDENESHDDGVKKVILSYLIGEPVLRIDGTMIYLDRGRLVDIDDRYY